MRGTLRMVMVLGAAGVAGVAAGCMGGQAMQAQQQQQDEQAIPITQQQLMEIAGGSWNDPADMTGEGGMARALRGARMFHTARMHRDSADGTGHDAGTVRQMQFGIQLLSMQGIVAVRSIVRAMAEQTSRPELVISGAELNYRIFPESFHDDIARLTRKGFKDSVRIYEETEKRFIAGKGKIGIW